VKDQTQKLLNKASRAIRAAETLLKQGDVDFASGRAYYAMFYTTEALLNEKDLRFRKHGGVHGAFGEYFAKSGLLDPKYHQWLLDAFDKRLKSDYDVDIVVTADDVMDMIKQAREFLQEARRFLGEV